LSALRKIGWTGYSRKTVAAVVLCLAMMDCVPDKYWPVWARPGNENIFSKIKIFGEEMV
jgi:hypothetical protein